MDAPDGETDTNIEIMNAIRIGDEETVHHMLNELVDCVNNGSSARKVID
jgi:hypothetical protein